MTATHSAYLVTYGMSTNADRIAITTTTTESQNVHADGVCIMFSPATTRVLHGGLFYHDKQPGFSCLKSHHATERGDDFPPVNVDCHATLHGLMTDARDGH